MIISISNYIEKHSASLVTEINLTTTFLSEKNQYIYIYIYICVCVCVWYICLCVCISSKPEKKFHMDMYFPKFSHFYLILYKNIVTFSFK